MPDSPGAPRSRPAFDPAKEDKLPSNPQSEAAQQLGTPPGLSQPFSIHQTCTGKVKASCGLRDPRNCKLQAICWSCDDHMLLVTSLPVDHQEQRGATRLKHTGLPHGRSILSFPALPYTTPADLRADRNQDLEITAPHILSTLQHETPWLYQSLCPIRMHRRRSQECRPEASGSMLCRCDSPSCNGRQPSSSRRHHGITKLPALFGIRHLACEVLGCL